MRSRALPVHTQSKRQARSEFQFQLAAKILKALCPLDWEGSMTCDEVRNERLAAPTSPRAEVLCHHGPRPSPVLCKLAWVPVDRA